MIRNIEEYDIEEVCNIYNYYVKNTIITFEEIEILPDEMWQRAKEVSMKYSFLVYEQNEKIIGYAYATKWKTRSAYRYSAESTIYLHPDYTMKGMGTGLYEALIRDAQKRNVHSIIGGIALPNEKSIALHEKLGFKKCAQFTQVGFKHEQWIDVGYWEKLL